MRNGRPSKRTAKIMAGLLACASPVVPVLVATAPAAAAECSSAAYAGIDWSKCNRRNIAISGSNLEKANVGEADLSSTDLRNSALTGAMFEKAKLVRASLAGSVADGANFNRVEGYRTDFSGVSAKGTTFQGAELQRAEFSDANLTQANFEKAELGRARFKGADLGGNRFAFANLARADFTGADIVGPLDFTDAYMFLTRLEGVDLSAATGLQQAQLELTCGDGKTRLPAGLTPPANWPCGSD